MCNWNSSWQRRTGIGSGEWRRHERVHLATRRANSTAQRQVPEATQIRMILNRIAKAHPVSLDIPVSRAKRMVTNIVSPSLTQLMTGVFQGIRWAFAVRGGKNDMAITWPSHISPDCSVPRAPASLKLRGKLCNRILANFAPAALPDATSSPQSWVPRSKRPAQMLVHRTKRGENVLEKLTFAHEAQPKRIGPEPGLPHKQLACAD